MSHHHHRADNVDRDERAVTKWLNTMEASLANPDNQFSIAKFSPREIHAINSYIASHEQYLGRYAQFLPPVQIDDSERRPMS